MRWARVVASVAASVVALTTFGASGAGGDVCWAYRPNEAEMARKVNGVRAARGLPRLQLDPNLSKLARRHTSYMARISSLFHTNDLGRKVTNWTSLGENIGYGSGVAQLHRLFMSSSSHRWHILNGSYRYLGVGTVSRGGFTWVTVIFEGRQNPGTILPMPSSC